MRNSKDNFNRWYKGRLILLGLIVVLCFACAAPLLDQALEGKLDLQAGNETIASYCQNCHVHKDVTDEQCLDEKPPLYDRAPYNTASECRVCHFLEKEFWRSSREARHTRRPEDVRQNKYVDFEKELQEEGRGNQIKDKAEKQKKEEVSSQGNPLLFFLNVLYRLG